MRYSNIHQAVFLRRPNRFIAHVELEGVETVCHVKNTGRCRELLVPGAEVWLEQSGNPNRKTAYDLVTVRKGQRLINMDAQAPNRIFREWAERGGFLDNLTLLKPEFPFGASRLDFYAEAAGQRHLIEVKGVTLEEDGVARFPDAPTERGVRHLQELTRAVGEDYICHAIFIVQMAGTRYMEPNDATHPAFGEALRTAEQAGVQVLALGCRVTPEEVVVSRRVPVRL